MIKKMIRLIGYKLEQYKLWLVALKASSRYSHIIFPTSNVEVPSMSLSPIFLLMFTMPLNEELIVEIFINNLFIDILKIFDLDFFYLNFWSLFSLTPIILNIPFNVKSQKPKTSIVGPLSPNIVSIIFGSLLGNADAKQNKIDNGTRITFFQEGIVVKYLLWLHNQLATAGYCNSDSPKITTKLGKHGKVVKIVRFSSWTFRGFNWIYDLWYINDKKRVPQFIQEYLTPLALAVWIMDNGYKSHGGLKLLTYSFSYLDCKLLAQTLHSKFKLRTIIKSIGKSNKYLIYINKESMPYLNNVLCKYIIPSMRYKILP
uniref:Homing endonuclease LAGLIDADG domain-containing protein n=1 Tax=Dactylella tenuis TaxID=383872 RepID=A0A4Y5MX37_9PEZI|nr:hypothetical protein [Dactylella tenuis]QCW06841.1 hypothetical protein [Dactylella tenuis]